MELPTNKKQKFNELSIKRTIFLQFVVKQYGTWQSNIKWKIEKEKKTLRENTSVGISNNKGKQQNIPFRNTRLEEQKKTFEI